MHNPVIQVAGKIAVVHRGSCEFLKKVEMVQKAGGIAMVLVNDGPGLSRMATATQWESAHVVEPNTAYTLCAQCTLLNHSRGNVFIL